MATSQTKYTVHVRKADVEALYPRVACGDLPEAALLPAAAFINAKRKLDETGTAHSVAEVLSWMPREERTMRVSISDLDRERFSRMAAICGMSEVGVDAAAAAVGCLRELQGDLGPSHTALDIIASVLPRQFVDNWAAKRLQAA